MQGLPRERMTQFHACTKSQGSRNEISKDEWLICIEKGVEETTKKQRIERVPSMLREVESYKKCYDPLVVSIGPYHHGKSELEAVEKLKFEFAKQFCHACGDQVSINELYAEVAKAADSARECYEEGSTTSYDDERFTRMMFLDACFVIQYMCILTNMEPKVDLLTTTKSYIGAFVWRDLFLLENQIPLLVLKVLLNFRSGSEELIQDYLELSTGGQTNDKRELQLEASPHLLDLMWRQLAGQPEGKTMKKSMKKDRLHFFRSITELKAAGIHFKASKTRHVTDVDFKDHLVYGTMTLPPLLIDDSTIPLLLNLVAYEMSPNGPSDPLITSYIWLMDSLIDNANDVKELRKERILINRLGSDEKLATLFNEIANYLAPNRRAYTEVMDLIDKRWRNKSRVWIAEWTHNHFSSPWTVLAFLGAIFALALTLVQTYFSIFPRS